MSSFITQAQTTSRENRTTYGSLFSQSAEPKPHHGLRLNKTASFDSGSSFAKLRKSSESKRTSTVRPSRQSQPIEPYKKWNKVGIA